MIPTCVWRLSGDLLLALDDRLGEPDDTYVNGSQVWLRDNGPSGVTLEWRLHPVAGFQRPASVSHYELFETTVYALRSGEAPPGPLDALWGGLEAFPVYDDDVEPAPLAAATSVVLGIAPDAFGLADHTTLGDRWEQTDGRIELIELLLAQLGAPAAPGGSEPSG